ncbi:hypothetical protein Q4489_04220 [Thalassotalea sp. 1_MG-2023]|uniref:hypothetical protein n=1 Tax=Thalassotalea sp. 1_MG-2023 TaxID=3062680 RepID=UPI0026E119F2|nr:hypothetical protein [Thalassotalea sp. 1_MG-2023]MDO6426202.1 hypothetical protein [Thalassotalea sp. 1_MG-2023]
MAKLTPKTANELYYDLTKQVIETANNAINLFLTRPSTSNLMHVEDTLIDLKPFAKVVKEHQGGHAAYIELLKKLSSVQERGTANLLNENEILSYFETEA